MLVENICIYSTNTCPYCVMAKKLLEQKGLSYTEIRVDLDEEERERMVARSGRRTVPQIFFGEQHIGGYDDLCAHFKSV